jgi:hypothetical protein
MSKVLKDCCCGSSVSFFSKINHAFPQTSKHRPSSLTSQRKATMSAAAATTKTNQSVHNDHISTEPSAATPGATTKLYDDSFTTLTTDGVVIHTYYFPIGTAKKFSWQDVESLEISDNSSMFSSKSWGSPDLVHWFGCHMWREFNSELKKIVAFKLKGASTLPSVTPIRADEFARICREQLAIARKQSHTIASTK